MRFLTPARHKIEDDDRIVSPAGRVTVEVVTTTGRAAGVEFRIRIDTVELWYHERLAAVFDRDVLAEWLREPGPALVVDEARLSIDWLVDVHGRIALTLPDVSAWTLSPSDLDRLYRHVVIGLREDRD